MQRKKDDEFSDFMDDQPEHSLTTARKTLKQIDDDCGEDQDWETSKKVAQDGAKKADFKIQRKKHGPSMIKAKWTIIKAKAEHGDDQSSYSMVEEDEHVDKVPKLQVKPLGKTTANNSSQSGSLNQAIPKEFRNYKKTTTLDDFYVQNNYMKLNPKNPYAGEPFDFKSEGFVIEVIQARFLPDTVNFVKVKGMLYSIGGKKLTELSSSVLRIEGDINQVTLDFMIKINDLACSNYDEVYLMIFWESFQDIFGDEDVEFVPIIFGFSVIKLFHAEGMKSLESCVG